MEKKCDTHGGDIICRFILQKVNTSPDYIPVFEKVYPPLRKELTKSLMACYIYSPLFLFV